MLYSTILSDYYISILNSKIIILFISKVLQLYHLKQYFTSVKNDLCNNGLNCKMESSKEELSNIFTINNFIKIRTDILYKQYLAFKYNSDHIAIRLVKKEL